MARLAAGVRKRTDGTLEKRFTINGSRYSVYGRTSKEISEKEQELRKEINAGIYQKNKNITLDKYFTEWQKRKRGSIKGNTLKLYKSCYYNHLSPAMGSKRVRSIERREIYQLQESLSGRLSFSTTNNVIKVLKMILDDAVQDDILLKNPVSGIKALKENKGAAETNHRALTEDEQRQFMKTLKGNYNYEFIALLLCTGMRFGEAAALTWRDVDYRKNVIHIRNNITYTEEGKAVVGSPKSESSIRDIPINDTIRDILTMQRKKMGTIIPIGTGNVFVAVYGGIVQNGEINRTISNTLSKLEEQGIHIEHFTAHALRDTFATRYIEQGGSPQTLKAILGHSSLAMTMDLYAHVLPNTKQKEMDNLKIVL